MSKAFGAVLVACEVDALLYERWSDALGMSTGELALVGLEQIAAVRVS